MDARQTAAPKFLRRPSTILIVVAVVLTVSIALIADATLWRLYETAMAPPTEVAAAPAEDEQLVVAVGRTSGGPQEWITLARVFAQVQRDIGRPIVLRYVPDPAEHEALMSDGETDLALISVRAYLHLTQKGPLQIVAVPVVRGNEADAAVLVVHRDSPAQELEDLRGRSIAVTRDLVSGPYARLLLAEQDTTPEEFFGAVEPHTTMDAALTHVANGDVDATTVRRSALASWPPDTFRVIAESPAFGMPPLVARPGLDDDTVNAVRESLLKIDESGTIPVTSSISRFRRGTDDEYDFGRELDRFETDHSANPGAAK